MDERDLKKKKRARLCLAMKKISFNGKVRSALQQGQWDNKPRGIKTGSSPQTFIDLRSKERKKERVERQRNKKGAKK